MKVFALAALLLLTLTAHAQTWPRNPQTGKVEFRGTLPWPQTAKTEAQRRALVRRWYLAKLTDETAAAVDEGARTSVSPALLTYAGMPTAAAIYSSKLPTHSTLSYSIMLRPLPNGFSYALNEFSFSKPSEIHLGLDLEQVLANNAEADRPALAALRKRLAAAVAHW